VPPSRPGRAAPIAVALAVLAALLAAASLLRPPGAAPTGDGAAVPPPGLTGFAELYVATWLSSGGAPGVLDPFLATAADLDGMDPGHRYVTRTAAVEASPLRDEIWSVTVAADVLDLVDGSYVPAGIEHYRVPISVDGVRLVVLSLPARVAAPQPARLPASPTAAEEAVPDALLATTDQFLTALLTGADDPNRFAAPEAGITPFRSAPYTAVAVVAVTGSLDGDDMVLQATVQATAAGGHVHVMQYALRAGERSGVWEILALGPVSAATGAS
jgi:hypothetical protein